MAQYEPLLDQSKSRLTTFPIEYPEMWEMYKTQLAAFWKAEEIDFSNDADDFDKLEPNEQRFIKLILAFFAASDGIVNLNLRTRFLNEIQVFEAQVVYTYQMMMENIHGEVYSLMLENIIKDPNEKKHLFNAIQTIPSVKLISDWAHKWIDSNASLANRVVAFAIVEGVFFSGAFASIFWLKKYRSHGKNIMNGLITSNKFIARDEGMHTVFACMLYKHINNRMTVNQVYDMMDEAVVIAKNFMDDAIPCKLIGINKELMADYIEHIGDRLLVMLGYDKKYNKANPFDFMDTIGLSSKANFFEIRPTEYQTAHNTNNVARHKIKLLSEF